MMPDIPIQNETDVELTSFIRDHIQREATEHFGESIRAIQVQQGIERHAFNAKTGVVRFAFFPSEYGLSDSTRVSTEIDGLEARAPSITDDRDSLVESDFVDDAAPDEVGLADLDDTSDIRVDDDNPTFEGFDDGPDFQELATDVDVLEGTDSDVLDEDAEELS